MSSSHQQELAFDPFAWAEIAKSYEAVSDYHAAIVSKLSQAFDVASCGLVCGMRMPRHYNPAQGVTIPGPDQWHGEFISPAWTARIIQGQEGDTAPNRIGKQQRPLWLYPGSRDWERFRRGHEKTFDAMEDHGFKSGVFVFKLHLASGNIDIAGVSSELMPKDFAQIENAYSAQLQLAFTFFSEALEVERVQAYKKYKALTQRELRCLSLASSGGRTQEIANKLSLSDATVNEHLASARKKLGASNRTQACTRAILGGLVSPDY